ncbi:uncharacterized protein LOC122142341 [Cyprinus carpio]|uniref:Uncharacterized protein LOC122142341 n=1 Tax=Cyprinus carpio TaxID=7962 RepID=A0A9Q9XWI8_CYPCA|nr:uncharacterized protein LOC122142341 [Cyprinus carpio]
MFPRFPSYSLLKRSVTEDPTRNSNLRVFPSISFLVFLPVFFFPLCPMDPLLCPEYLLLLLEQGKKLLRAHTRLFWVLASLTNYTDNVLSVFYDTILNITYRAPSSEDGLRANFFAFVEWTLVRNRSPFPASSPKRLSPVPLLTQSLTHHLPVVRSLSPPAIHQLHWTPSSLRLRLGWASNPPTPLDSSPLAAPCRSIPPASFGLFLPPAPPWSSVPSAPLRSPGPLDPCPLPGSLPSPLPLRLCLWLLVHGSSLRRLHRRSTSCCGLGPAGLLLLQAPPVSSLICCPPGLYLPAVYRVLRNPLLSSHLCLPLLLLQCEDLLGGGVMSGLLFLYFFSCDPDCKCFPQAPYYSIV